MKRQTEMVLAITKNLWRNPGSNHTDHRQATRGFIDSAKSPSSFGYMYLTVRPWGWA